MEKAGFSCSFMNEIHPIRRHQNSRNPTRNITFESDSNITFVNYSNDKDLSYRHEARVHNAHRHARRSNLPCYRFPNGKGLTSKDSQSTKLFLGDVQTHGSGIGIEAHEQDPIAAPSEVESQWRSVFQHHFHLPRVAVASSTIPDPQEAFLNTAKISLCAYRSIVVQPVLTSQAEKQETTIDDVFRYQALIIQDFRQLAEKFSDPHLHLDAIDFQHLFAPVVSFVGRDFEKEAGLNAIMIIFSSLMTSPPNRTIQQLPAIEWIRTLMPRPGPSFNRSQAFQCEMLKKVNMFIDFMEETQRHAHSRPRWFSQRYLGPNASLHKIVTMSQGYTINEPYRGFQVTYHTRILCMIHTFINKTTAPLSFEQDRFMVTLENLATECLQYKTPLCYTLFLWALLAHPDARRWCWDYREPLFSWAVRDLLAEHDISFTSELLACMLCAGDQSILSVLDIEDIRRKVASLYGPT